MKTTLPHPRFVVRELHGFAGMNVRGAGASVMVLDLVYGARAIRIWRTEEYKGRRANVVPAENWNLKKALVYVRQEAETLCAELNSKASREAGTREDSSTAKGTVT